MALEVIDYGLGKIQDHAEGIAKRLAGLLRTGIETRGHACLALSGGRSPVPMFQTLRDVDLDWSKVFITLVDDRWVDRNSTDSNECSVRTHLLQGNAAAANFVGLKTPAATPAEALAAKEQELSHFPLPFDAVVLGMGEDGHFASLFPGAIGLVEGLDLANPRLLTAIDPPVAPYQRISLTLAGVLRSRQILLTIAGEAKRKIQRQALEGTSPLVLPIAAVLGQQQVPVEIHVA